MYGQGNVQVLCRHIVFFYIFAQEMSGKLSMALVPEYERGIFLGFGRVCILTRVCIQE